MIPPGANVTNVLDHGIKGDNHTDNAAALNALFNNTKLTTFWFPPGQYLVSEPLVTVGRGCITSYNILLGSPGSVLAFQDNLPYLQNSSDPRALLTLGCAPAQNFHDGIDGLTLSTGRSNPGAIALRFNSNNDGWLRHLLIDSPDKSGHIGLDLSYTGEIGPLLVKDITVQGFDTGIKVKQSVDSVTMANIQVLNPQSIGVFITSQTVSVESLQVVGTPRLAGVALPHSSASVVLKNATFVCTSGSKCTAPAISVNYNASKTTRSRLGHRAGNPVGVLVLTSSFENYNVSILNAIGTGMAALQEAHIEQWTNVRLFPV